MSRESGEAHLSRSGGGTLCTFRSFSRSSSPLGTIFPKERLVQGCLCALSCRQASCTLDDLALETSKGHTETVSELPVRRLEWRQGQVL